MKINIKNWKTTLAGIVSIVIQLGPVFFPKYITETVANTISVVAASLGIIAAKDHNVTGGTVVNAVNDTSAVEQTLKTDQPK